MDKIALATGLGINFHKSTLVPMYVSGEVLAGTRRATNRRVEGFPWTYLGLPLSATKLKLEAFPPLLPKLTSFSSASPLCSYPGSAGRGGGGSSLPTPSWTRCSHTLRQPCICPPQWSRPLMPRTAPSYGMRRRAHPALSV